VTAGLRRPRLQARGFLDEVDARPCFGVAGAEAMMRARASGGHPPPTINYAVPDRVRPRLRPQRRAAWSTWRFRTRGA
jgi:hypothetical protein